MKIKKLIVLIILTITVGFMLIFFIKLVFIMSVKKNIQFRDDISVEEQNYIVSKLNINLILNENIISVRGTHTRDACIVIFIKNIHDKNDFIERNLKGMRNLGESYFENEKGNNISAERFINDVLDKEWCFYFENNSHSAIYVFRGNIDEIWGKLFN